MKNKAASAIEQEHLSKQIKSEILISVIVATHNAADSIENLLNSLDAQTDKRFEVIIQDDLSTDRTLDIVSNRNATHITTINSEADNGIYDAWHKALSAANGKLAVFLGADDSIHPSFVAKVLARWQQLDSPESCILFGRTVQHSPDGYIVKDKIGAPLKESVLSGVGFLFPSVALPIQLVKNYSHILKLNYKVATDLILLRTLVRDGVPQFPHHGVAYMQAGGISDRKFKLGKTEYLDHFIKSDAISPKKAKINILVNLAYHYLSHLSAWRIARDQLPGIALSIINGMLYLPLPFSIRHAILKLMGWEIGSGAAIHRKTTLMGVNPVKIGKNTILNPSCTLDNRFPIRIGHNTSISSGCKIFTTGHDVHGSFFELRKKEVTIGSNVVIFSSTIINPGVTIGNATCINTGSVITKSTGESEIWRGNPAQKVGDRTHCNRYKLKYQRIFS